MNEKNSHDEIMKSLIDNAFFDSVGGTSLSAIATAIHIKKSSIYNHFNSRDDLISQTTKSCSEYIGQIHFIPENVDAVTKKYDAKTVLTGLVKRYLKMHEKSPLFQVYTFIYSQQYFDREAAEIIGQHKETLLEETMTILQSLAKNKKIKLPEQSCRDAAFWFVSGVAELLNLFLSQKRNSMTLRNTDRTQIQCPPSEEADFDKAVTLVEGFCALIG